MERKRERRREEEEAKIAGYIASGASRDDSGPPLPPSKRMGQERGGEKNSEKHVFRENACLVVLRLSRYVWKQSHRLDKERRGKRRRKKEGTIALSCRLYLHPHAGPDRNRYLAERGEKGKKRETTILASLKIRPPAATVNGPGFRKQRRGERERGKKKISPPVFSAFCSCRELEAGRREENLITNSCPSFFSLVGEVDALSTRRRRREGRKKKRAKF